MPRCGWVYIFWVMQRGGVAAGLAAVLGLLVGCPSSDEGEDDVFARALIGPEGGEVAGGSVVLDIPAGALTAETEIELRRAEINTLTAPGYRQAGAVISIHPEGLILRQPAALTFTNSRDEPAVLVQQDGLPVATHGDTAYINEFAGAVASTIEEETMPRVVVQEPSLGLRPDDAGTTLRDTVRLSLEVSDTPDLAVVLTIYDTDEAYDKPLNGTGEGECGFRLLNINGGSLAGDCTEGSFTGTVRTTTSLVSFDIEPFLSGKMETPVTVGLVVGNEEVAYHAGFFSFDTGSCFNETCSGVGTCVPQGGSAVCECDEGFQAEGLECVCAPQCDGRLCGPDSCGGTCDPGCGEGEVCNDEAGQCEPDDTPPPATDSTDGGDSTSDGGGMSSDGMMGTTDGTTGGGGSSSGTG